MANTYTWTINALDIHTSVGSLANVVYNIHWGMTATSDQNDEEGNPYVASTIGTQTVSAPDETDFTDFESLTQDIVESWLESSQMEVDQIKAGLDFQIQEQITPSTQTKDVPW